MAFRLVVAMVAMSAVVMVVDWVDLLAASKAVNLVDELVVEKVVYSAARSAVCWVASTDVLSAV